MLNSCELKTIIKKVDENINLVMRFYMIYVYIYAVIFQKDTDS